MDLSDPHTVAALSSQLEKKRNSKLEEKKKTKNQRQYSARPRTVSPLRAVQVSDHYYPNPPLNE